MTTPTLSLQDLERLQRDRPNFRMELVNGEIRIMGPAPEIEPSPLSGAKAATLVALAIRDLEELQCDRPDLRMELVNGEIRVMSPSGCESDAVSLRLAARLAIWVEDRRLGQVFGSSAGFILPNKNQDVRSPDAAFVQADRLRKTPKGYAKLAPDLIVEVKSPSDSTTQLRQKVRSFLEVGTQVGILVNPDNRTVEIYRPEQETPQVLRDGDVLAVPELLPGWSVAISDLWPPIF